MPFESLKVTAFIYSFLRGPGNIATIYLYRLMQIQHSSDTSKILGELHGGAALSECLLATCQSYLEINRYLILEKRSLRNEPILVLNEVFYVFQRAVPYSYFIE